MIFGFSETAFVGILALAMMLVSGLLAFLKEKITQNHYKYHVWTARAAIVLALIHFALYLL